MMLGIGVCKCFLFCACQCLWLYILSSFSKCCQLVGSYIYIIVRNGYTHYLCNMLKVCRLAYSDMQDYTVTTDQCILFKLFISMRSQVEQSSCQTVVHIIIHHVK